MLCCAQSYYPHSCSTPTPLGELALGRVAQSDLVAQLQRLNFAPLGDGGGDGDGDGDGDGGGGGSGHYKHLLGMPLQSLTEERLVQLTTRRQTRCARGCSLANCSCPPSPRRVGSLLTRPASPLLASRQADAESLRCTTPEQLWMRELEALRPVLQAAIERP